MNYKIIIYGLFFSIYSLTACSSGSDEKNNRSKTEDKTLSVDTSLHGLTGVLEKNPPVKYGDYVSKYPNGVIKMRGYYINGKRNGQWTSFFENGDLQSEGFFKNGLRDGKATVYYQNGKIYYEGFYKDGREAGKWVFYNEEGKVIQEKNYDKPNS